MKANRIASRYAKAFISLGTEQNVLQRIFEDMTMFEKACEGTRELALLLRSPLVKTDKKLAILKSIFSKSFCEESMAFINIITSKKREQFLEQIIEEFFVLYKKQNNIVSAVITTPFKLDSSLKKLVEDKVAQIYNAEVEVEEKIKEDIIGGFVLRVGDDQWDSSVRKDIRVLKKQIV